MSKLYIPGVPKVYSFCLNTTNLLICFHVLTSHDLPMDFFPFELPFVMIVYTC